MASKGFLTILKAVIPDVISLKDAIPSEIFCIPISTAKANADPLTTSAPNARDSGIASNFIPNKIHAPSPLRSAIMSAIVNIIAPAINAIRVNTYPRFYLPQSPFQK